VDFVVHSGDLFDTGRPDVETMIQCVKQLMRLKEKGIPFYTVWGSHDVSLTETPIELLETLGLAVNLSSKERIEVDEKITLSGVKYKDAFIAGVPGRRANASAIYERLKVKPDGKFNIFVFHHTVSEADNITSDIAMSLLPKGFDYYAGGHWHKRCDFSYDKGTVVYPGSTEFNTVDEMDEPDRGFYVVDTETGEKTFVKSNTRQAIVKKLEVKELTVAEVNDLILESVPNQGNNTMLILRLHGQLKSGAKSMIDREKVNQVAEQRGFLIAKTYVTQLLNPEVKVHVETRKRSLEEIERDFLSKLGYKSDVVEMAIEITKSLGKDMTPSEKEQARGHATSIIKEVLGLK
jgi:DNA repair exonuclease SbcCD nuclease subunit